MISKSTQERLCKAISQDGLILFSLFTLLYLQHSWVPGFFFDGYIYAGINANAAMGELLIPKFAEQIYPEFFMHPPLGFWIHGFFYKIFGDSWSAVRLIQSSWMIAILLLFRSQWNKIAGDQSNRPVSFFLFALGFVLNFHLIRNARFPNLDLALVFFSSVSLISYYKNKDKSGWFMAALFWGLALLVKGPPALFVPAVILTHTLWEKRFKDIFKLAAFSIIGFAIFSIWPLLLNMNGRLDIFHSWLNHQVLSTVVEGRGNVAFDFFVFFKTFLKSSPWILIPVLIISFQVTQMKDSFSRLCFSWFWLTTLALSMMKFKLSHYALPVYPAYAFLFALFCTQKRISIKKIRIGLKYLIGVAAFVMIVFPVSVKSRRDFELRQTHELIRSKTTETINWGLYQNGYGLWNFYNYLGWKEKKNIFHLNKGQLLKAVKMVKDSNSNWMILISSADYEVNKNDLNKNFKIFSKTKDKQTLYLISNTLFEKHFIFSYK